MPNPVAVGDLTKKSQYDVLYDAGASKILQYVETKTTSAVYTAGTSMAVIAPVSGDSLESSSLAAGTYFVFARVEVSANCNGVDISLANSARISTQIYHSAGTSVAEHPFGLNVDTDLTGTWSTLEIYGSIPYSQIIVLAGASTIAIRMSRLSSTVSGTVGVGSSMHIFRLWAG